MKRMLLIAAACAFMATPAMADLFDFSYNSLLTSFNGTTRVFTADVQNNKTIGVVSRYDIAVNDYAFFDTTWPKIAPSLENFNVTLNVGAIVPGSPATAPATGTFTVTDKGGDYISGAVEGTWTDGLAAHFAGDLSNITFTDVAPTDGFLNGDSSTAMSMTFPLDPPWQGVLIELEPGSFNGTHLWFNTSWASAPGGSVDATVVPLPGAVLLGFLGLAAAGVRLRRAL